MKGFILASAIPVIALRTAMNDPVAWHNFCISAHQCLVAAVG
ncbi:MAG: hypothetical protein JWM86_1129 [Thermoleophilia bacterium]|nr:hypothetical protein [Thermoleophilia bacterium]